MSYYDKHAQWKVFSNVVIGTGKYFDLSKCKFTDELSIAKSCQNPLLRDYTSSWLKKLNYTKERTSQLARDYQELGDRYFNEYSDENDLSADYYTKAIFSAPPGSAALPLAHLDRAGCFVNMERFYEAGYSDCKLALQFDCPKRMLPTLFERKIQLANLIDNNEYIVETQLEMRQLNIRLNKVSFSFLKNHPTDVPKQIDDPKMSIKNKKLVEKINSSKRRHLITEEAIERNEQIYCEKAFSFVPTYKHNELEPMSYACQNCATINCLPFPCYDCARASYCSPICLAKHASIHKYECVGFQKNLWIKMGVCYLAFRTVMVGFNEMVAILNKTRPASVDDAWCILQLDWHEQFPYGHMLRMPSQMDKIDVKDVLRFGLTAQLIIIYLSDYTNFFAELPPVCYQILANVDDWKTIIAALIVKHTLQGFFYGPEQPQLQLLPPTQLRRSYGYGSFNIHMDYLHLALSTSAVFAAFFPRLSIANHSCDPNAQSIVDGNHLFLYAARNIKQNAEILITYGPQYKVSSPVDRQLLLRVERYFKCECKRCASNDPTWLKYYEYYCPDEECNVFVEMERYVDTRWWYFLADTDYTHQISEHFFCRKCKKTLPMNPAFMEKFERASLGKIEKNGITFSSSDNFIVTKNLLDLYFSVSNCLGKYHELKTRMAHLILGYLLLDMDVKLFPRMAYVTMENYVNRIERYGTHTVEFILVSTYALSILKIATRIERTNTLAPMARDIAKIRSILDVTVIEKSLQILPLSLQIVFRNIIRDIHSDSDNFRSI